MFSLGKNKKDGLSWHADFRLLERLPDTKVVRTSFLVNVVFCGICGLIALVVGYRELTTMSLKSEMRRANADREDRMKANDALLESINRFRVHANSVDDLNRFYEAPFDVIELMVSLSNLRNPEVAFDSIKYSNDWNPSARMEEFVVSLDGKGKTTEDIIALKANLRNLSIASGYDLSVIEEGNPVKEPRSGYFSFRIRVIVSKKK